jgi:site-specific DNA-methyltransferase (adenine-specific)
MAGMQDNSVNTCITSPPYNYNLRIHLGKYTKRSVNEKTKYAGSMTDALPMIEYFNWQKKVIDEMMRVTKGLVFYNIQMITGNKVALMMLLGHFAEQVKEIIIWDKKHSEPAMSERVLNSEWEFIIVFDKKNAIARQFDIANFKRGELSNMFRIKKNASNDLSEIHSAAFPRPLPYRLIEYFTNNGDTIYDPFIGTGTTALCCIELERNFLGSEINNQYFKLANRRIKYMQSQQKLFRA